MGSRGHCLQPRQGAHKPASEEATTVEDNGTNEGGQTDWCTCIVQMQWFTILFLWNKELCTTQNNYLTLFCHFVKESIYIVTSIFFFCLFVFINHAEKISNN